MILLCTVRFWPPIWRGARRGVGRSAVLIGLLPGSLVISETLLLHIFLVVSLAAYLVLPNWSRDELGNKLMSDMESLCFKLKLLLPCVLMPIAGGGWCVSAKCVIV